MELVTQWQQEACLSCKALFALPKTVLDRYREDHKSFYCPYCKLVMFYPEKTEEEKLRELLADEQKCCISAREEANSLEYKVRAYKGVVTKLRRTK